MSLWRTIRSKLENSRPEDAAASIGIEQRDVYALDTFTRAPILNVMECKTGAPLQIYRYVADPRYTDSTVRSDWIWIIVSSSKLIETFTLWRLDSRLLCWVTSASWFYFFCCATILQWGGLSRGCANLQEPGSLDILMGELPTARKPGGPRKLLLEVPPNHRRHFLWKIVWGVGGFVCATSVIASYLILGKQEVIIVYTWALFQIIWLALRLICFHLTKGPSIICPILAISSMETLSPSLKERVLDLMFALSKYQMHIHPRSNYSYDEDLQSSEEWRKLGSQAIPQIHAPTHPTSTKFELTISAVIGDTTLTSAAWLAGSKLSGMDLYDSCVLILNIRGTYISVPAARALCSSINLNTDVEGSSHVFSPKGSINLGPETVRWHYWIPVSNDRWAHTQSVGLKILGKRELEVWNETEISQHLLTSGLNIGLRCMEDLKEVAETSRVGYLAMTSLMK
jgi:hypothetical protein